MEKERPDLQLAGIQHFSFCRRQWALIHIEQQWSENFFTIDGQILHENADDPFYTEKRGNLIISRAMPVRSSTYGISGRCDVVEFYADENGIRIAGRDGLWRPCPVEYKRGKSKEIDADRLQVCAQAICLEEMLCCGPLSYGYLYYNETRRREQVALDDSLRKETMDMLEEMRELYDRGHTPTVKPSAKCRSCSLRDICLPKMQKQKPVQEYIQQMWGE